MELELEGLKNIGVRLVVKEKNQWPVCFGCKEKPLDLHSLAKNVRRDKVQHVLTSLRCGCGRYGTARCSGALAFLSFSCCLVASEYVWERLWWPVGGSCKEKKKKKKRISLHTYKRSGAACNSSACEIPLASEESRTSTLLERCETGLETCRCCYLCLCLNAVKRSVVTLHLKEGMEEKKGGAWTPKNAQSQNPQVYEHWEKSGE